MGIIYINTMTGHEQTKEAWLNSYSNEELVWRKMSPQQAFEEDLELEIFKEDNEQRRDTMTNSTPKYRYRRSISTREMGDIKVGDIIVKGFGKSYEEFYVICRNEDKIAVLLAPSATHYLPTIFTIEELAEQGFEIF